MKEDDGSKKNKSDLLVSLEKAHNFLKMNEAKIDPPKFIFNTDRFARLYSLSVGITIEQAKKEVELEVYKRSKLGIVDKFSNVVFIVMVDEEQETNKDDEILKAIYDKGEIK